MKLIPVILCGGAGSRLWPVSRDTHPKPFIRLDDGQSLLQKAYLRATAIPDVSEVFTVTNRELLFKINDEYRELNGASIANTFILEPSGRNTAPAIAAATLRIAQIFGEETLLLILTADHLISDQASFEQAVNSAMKLGSAGKIVTFGIEPTSPDTGYGYIEYDKNRVVQFVEKPSIEKAMAYVESGRYLWNSGMFCFTAGAMRREMEQHCPEILAGVASCLEQSRVATSKGFSQIELDASLFEHVPSISIDYAVMEKSTDSAIVPCDIGWSDIGSWAALGDLVPPDANGNRIEGQTVLHDVSNCHIRGSDRIIGAVGLDNIVVIDTPDALLVADRSRTQDVKHLYTELKARGHEAHKLHRTVHRPWGTYTVLEDGKEFKIKRIVVKPGGTLSLQMHHHRSEHWVVVSGMAKVVNGEEERFIRANESTYIPAGHKHRLENPGMLDLVLIEVQCGEYLGEDDIVRFSDIYGRAS